MEFKGTRGNWENKEIFTHSGSFNKIMCENISICNIITRNQEQAEANAKLIAAAPEMFAILKSLSIVNHKIPKWLLDEINELLTKITK